MSYKFIFCKKKKKKTDVNSTDTVDSVTTLIIKRSVPTIILDIFYNSKYCIYSTWFRGELHPKKATGQLVEPV